MYARHEILVIDDDPAVRAALRECLELEGYACRAAADPLQAVSAVRCQPPDLILLDRVLPGTSGDDILRELKRDPRTATIPVILLSAKSDESDELVGLSLGADDYLTKPFSPKRLLARVAVKLRDRTSGGTPNEALPRKSVMLDRSQARVVIDQQAIDLSGLEYRLLAALIAARGHLLDDRQLRGMIGASEAEAGDVDIAVRIDELRRKMGTFAGCIQSVDDQHHAFCYPSGQCSPA